MNDLKFAWRQLLKSRGFTAVAVLTLAMGIGANTAIFSIVRAILIDPLPYRDSDRLIFVWLDRSDVRYPRAPLSSPDLRDLRERSRTCSEFGGIWASGTVALTGGDAPPEQLRAASVTPNFFDVLGAACALGRTFRPADAEPGAAPTILLGWDLFERRFGGDPALIGRQIEVNRQWTTVIGVMPKHFRLLLPPDAAVPDHLQVWQPMGRDFEEWPRKSLYLRVIGRMRSGVTLDQARQDIAAIARAITVEAGVRRSFSVMSLHADGVRELRGPLLALFAGVTILLAIACVNVASLLTARALGRARETAVRLALGATRGRLVRECLIEGGLLTLLGVVAAAWLGWAGLKVLLAHLPESLSRIGSARIDLPVLAFTAGISVVWGLLFSLVPLLELRKIAPATCLDNRLSPLGRYAGPGYYRRRGFLVASQTALSLVLLVGAGLLVRTFLNLQRADLGYQVDRRLTFRVALPHARFPTGDMVVAGMMELQQRLAAIPGVTSAGAISHLPFDDLPNWGLSYASTDVSQHDGAPFAHARAVTPGLLETLGVPLIEGRFFTEQDGQAENPVVIIDDVLAQRLWPNQNAVGREFMLGQGEPDRRVSVAGVVRHIKQRRLTGNVGPQVFLPYRFWQRWPMAFVLQSDDFTNPQALTASVRSAVAAFDPLLPIYDVRPLAQYIAEARSTRRFTMALIAAFAASALGLTCIGLYGTLCCTVAQRRHEFGLRSVLGAAPRQLGYQVLRESLKLAGAGCVAGLMLAPCLTRLLQHQLHGTHSWEPATCGGAVALVLGAAVIASWIPVRQATMVSPMEALKGE